MDGGLMKRVDEYAKRKGFTYGQAVEALLRLGLFFDKAPVGAVITRSQTGMSGFDAPKAPVRDQWQHSEQEVVF